MMASDMAVNSSSVASTVLRTEVKALSKSIDDLMAVAPKARMGVVSARENPRPADTSVLVVSSAFLAKAVR